MAARLRWCAQLLIWGLLIWAKPARCNDGMTEIVPECTSRQRDYGPPSQCCVKTTAEPGSTAKYAYVTLMGGVGNSYEYRGYLYNIAIMGMVLREMGSVADVVVLVVIKPLEEQQKLANIEKPTCGAPQSERHHQSAGNPPLLKLPEEDEELLRRHGVKIRYTELMYGDAMHFGSVVFTKTLAFQFTEYQAVQFLDADIMPLVNMDAFFGLPRFTICAGMVSPLNAGWIRLEPSCEDYKNLRNFVVVADGWGRGNTNSTRSIKTWSKDYGWGEPTDASISWQSLTGRSYPDWTFHHANCEQGLYYYYYGFVKKEMDQILYDEVNTFGPSGTTSRKLSKKWAAPYPDLLGFEGGFPCLRAGPKVSYAHFTGQRKPWIRPDLSSTRSDLWWSHFEKLGLGIKRADIPPNCLKSPAGFYHPAEKDTTHSRSRWKIKNQFSSSPPVEERIATAMQAPDVKTAIDRVETEEAGQAAGGSWLSIFGLA